MNRRELLQTAMAGTVGVALVGVQRACLADADFNAAIRHPFMNAAQKQVVAIVAELIIPETDTAGATKAGVPEFIELMLSDWYTPDERQPFIAGVEQLNTECSDRFNAEFAACSEQQQTAALTAVKDSEFFSLLKNLTVYGYYTSEVGVNAELKFNPAPGRYTTIDFDEVGRQWAS